MNTNTYIKVQHIQLIHSGANYFETLILLIQNSKHSIYLQTYIFASDDTGMQVISALKLAASRGIKVYVLIDAFGSYSYRAELKKAMQHSGIHFRFFSPLFSRESILPWRRLHHKVLISDQHKTLLGGINIANKYNALADHTPWLDYAVLIEGGATSLSQYCETLHFKKKTRINFGNTYHS